MPIEIKEVTSKRELDQFIKLPFELYKNNPYWVPPIIMEEKMTFTKGKNPALDFCDVKLFLAIKNNKPVGRIASIINHKANEVWKSKHARFGWIDFIDDYEVSSALFRAAESFAIEKGMEAIHGPLGFTDFDKEGMLIFGFNELSTTATIYNHPYYQVHTEKAGYHKDADWVEFEIKADITLPEKHKRIAELVKQKNGLRLLNAKNKKELIPYIPQIFDLINESYRDIYGFVPANAEQVKYYTKLYFGFVNPEFVPVVLNSDNKVVGVGITMPNISKALQKAKGKLFPFGFIYLLRALKKMDTVDFYLTAIKPELQNKGVNALLFAQLIPTYNKYKILKAETNIELEENHKIQNMWEDFEKRNHKRRRAFIKHF